MLALKIIATVFLGISIFANMIKNSLDRVYYDSEDVMPILITIYNMLWQAFVLVVIWNI